MIIGKAISPFSIKRRNGGGGGGNDADAQAFITASGISGTNATAINTLVVNLKSASIWTKMKALYPMVGGTATSCKFNLKDSRDLDAAFRLSFIGGATFSANGIQFNGTNSYADTFLTPNAIINNNHLSFYSRTDVNLTQVDMGTTNATNVLDIESRITNLCYSNSSNAALLNYANTSSLGFYINSRTSAASFKAFKNGLLKATSLTGTTTTMPFNIFIGARNGSPLYYSSKQCAFASIGDGLTDAEALALYNAVQTFNTTLLRNV